MSNNTFCKLILIIILLSSCVFSSFSQSKEEMIPVERYVLHSQEDNSWYQYLLDTRAGVLRYIEANKNPEKLHVISLKGGPCIPEQQSYNGRFTMSYFNGQGHSFFMILDTKTGEMWHVRYNVITKVN